MTSSFDFLNKEIIFLSPHIDDVCFSLGVLAKASQRGWLINIFNVSGYLPGMHGLKQEGFVSKVTSIRKLEDEAFADAASLTIVSLDLLDAPLRGLKPLDSKPSEKEMEYVEGTLFNKLAEIGSEFGQKALLLAPAGIGGHIDHLTIRDWAISNLSELNSKYSVGFYEDLHYASDPEVRRSDLRDLMNHVPKQHQLTRIRYPINDVSEKLDLLRIYQSQFPKKDVNIDNFIPAESDRKSPHEAFWLVSSK